MCAEVVKVTVRHWFAFTVNGTFIVILFPCICGGELSAVGRVIGGNLVTSIEAGEIDVGILVPCGNSKVMVSTFSMREPFDPTWNEP